ncbi:MAG: hypothetical protein IJB79_09150 [Candidatus Gastranaerophilales bacterium]|nr:hypothetical protein [Candidatus Gastranaerophilales bacterium]
MAITKLKITSLILLFSLIISLNSTFANENIPNYETKDFDEIYSQLQEADFDYIFGLDPHQTDDYTKYMHSPYPLFRSGVNLVFKSKTIPPGYYLLTPREKNGKTYILFKENGKVSYTIPVYEEDIVPETFYEEKMPHPKPTFSQKASKKFMNFIGTKWGHKNQRTPIPEAYIEFNDKGSYWDMVLYYGFKKYYLLFKKD